MARKRKIPVKKHHGIRDPLKHQEREYKKIKNKINNPPEKGGDQKISYKLAQFIKLANDPKHAKKMKNQMIHGNEDKPRKPKNGQNASKIKRIKQFAEESDENYLKRVNRATTESLQEAQYEAKYGVNVIRDAKTGKISIKKRPKEELEDSSKKSRKRKSGDKITKIDPKMAKELIKQAIKEDKEESKKEEIVEFKRDTFKFGEIVHGPPSLTTIPRKAQKCDTVPRPGMKDNLLLKSLLKEDADSSTETPTKSKSKKATQQTQVSTDLKGKRKDLSRATRQMIEDEQNKVIELYRQLKKNKSVKT